MGEEIHKGNVRCTVTSEVGGLAWQIRFHDEHEGLELYFQSDVDQASFMQSCGYGTPDWDGDAVSDPAYVDFDPTVITQCSDEYLDVAEIIFGWEPAPGGGFREIPDDEDGDEEEL